MDNKRTIAGKNGPIEVEFIDLTQDEFDDLLDSVEEIKAVTDREKKRELEKKLESSLLTNSARVRAEAPRAVMQSLISEALEWQARTVDTKKSA
jgi:hypothetical protein